MEEKTSQLRVVQTADRWLFSASGNTCGKGGDRSLEITALNRFDAKRAQSIIAQQKAIGARSWVGRTVIKTHHWATQQTKMTRR